MHLQLSSCAVVQLCVVVCSCSVAFAVAHFTKVGRRIHDVSKSYASRMARIFLSELGQMNRIKMRTGLACNALLLDIRHLRKRVEDAINSNIQLQLQRERKIFPQLHKLLYIYLIVYLLQDLKI